MPAKLNGPIPGQSLTTEPNNMPWEQPSKYEDAQQALAFYLQRLEDPDLMDELFFVLEQGMPLSVLVESMTTCGVMEGYHTIDVSILINPVLHEYMLALATAADIDVVEDDGPSKTEKQKAKAKKRLVIMLQDDFGGAGEVNVTGSDIQMPTEEAPNPSAEPAAPPTSPGSEAPLQEPPPPDSEVGSSEPTGLVPRRQ